MPRFVLVAAGCLGLAVVARAAALYRGTDPLAFALVMAIAAGLLIGLVELWGRIVRADRLSRTLRSLPPSITMEALDAAPEPLRNVLKARMAGGVATAAPVASLTAYLIGMVVMLGMLGTFLGLFESLRGAREALSTGGDVDALRSGLAAPMAGLSRAFGTSATGVSASALLGLALVFTRREEARFSRELATFSAGPLLPLTLQGRTLAALEAVAARSEALPETARAVQSAVIRVEELEAQVLRERKETTEKLVELTQTLVTELRSSVGGLSQTTRSALEEASRATCSSLEAVSAKVASSLDERSRAQLEAMSKLQEETSAALRSSSEETSAALRASVEATQELVRTTSLEAVSSFEKVGRTTAETLSELVQRAGGSLEQAGRETTTALREVVGETSTALREAATGTTTALREVTTETTAVLRDTASDTTTALREVTTETTTVLRDTATDTTAALREVTTETTTTLRETATDTTTTLREMAGETTSVLREVGSEQLEASRHVVESANAAVREGAEQMRELLAKLGEELRGTAEQVASQVGEEVREASRGVQSELRSALDDAARGAAEAIGPIAEQATERAGETARAHLSRWIERMEEDADERQRAEKALGEQLAAMVEQVGGRVRELVETTAQQSGELLALSELVREQATDLRSASEQQIAQVAEQAQKAIEERQLLLIDLDERLGKLRTELSSALVERVEAHATELRDTTTETAGLAKEAAELLRAGSAEISAAAELLTSAIDRHREASERWLDNIASGAPDSGPRASTEPMVDETLDRTREALEHVVELQREMLDQVRSLRPAAEEAG